MSQNKLSVSGEMNTLQSKVFYFGFLILVVIFANVFTDGYTFEPYYALYEDNTNSYFFQSLNDSTLFTNDAPTLLFKESIANIKGNFVIASCYSAVMKIFSMPIAIKVLRIALCYLAMIAIYKTSARLYSRDFAMLCVGLFIIYFLSMNSFFGAGGRTFGATVFCFFIWFFSKELFLVLPFFLVLAAKLYPPIFVMLLLICILNIFFYKDTLARLGKRRLYIICLLFALTLVLFLNSQNLFTKNVFENIQNPQIHQYKYIQNVSHLIDPYNFSDALTYFILNLNEHSQLYLYFTKFLLISSICFLVLRRKKVFNVPKFLWVVMLGSFLGFGVLYPLNPTAASRQLVFSLPLFLVFFFSLNLYSMIGKRIKTMHILIIFLCIFMFLHPKYNNITGYKQYKALYERIETLPKDVMIAGHSESNIVRAIPFFSKKTIFSNRELNAMFILSSLPVDHLLSKQRHMLLTLYSDSFRDIQTAIEKYDIDYFVIESQYYRDHYLESLRDVHFPNARELFASVDPRRKHSFVLFDFAKKHYDFKLDAANLSTIYLVSARKFKEQYSQLISDMKEGGRYVF